MAVAVEEEVAAHAPRPRAGRPRRSVLVLALWLGLAACALPFALRSNDRVSATGFEVAGSQSARVAQLLHKGLPADARPSSLAVVVRPGAAARAEVERVIGVVRRMQGVSLNPIVSESARTYARQGTRKALVMPLTVKADSFHAGALARVLTRAFAREGSPEGQAPTVIGQPALWQALIGQGHRDLREAERIALVLALLILVAATGSPLVTLIPLGAGVIAVAVAAGALWWLGRAADMTVFAPNLASMIGLGVGIDYALFIVVRHRQELRAGAGAAEAVDRAIATAGRAVTASAAAVAVALAGLWLLDTAALRSMAAAAIVAVAVALTAARTLVPAALRVLAGRISPEPARPSRVPLALRRPGATLGCGTVLLLALAAPALGLHTGDGALRQLPQGDRTRAASELAQREAGPGRASPVELLVPPDLVGRATAVTRADPEVRRTGVTQRTRDGRYVLVLLRLRHEAETQQAIAVIGRLRRDLPRGVLLGGDSAGEVDFNAATTGGLWKTGLWVALVTLVVLWLVLRSARLVTIAFAANLLSLGAAVGVLALAFGGRGYVDTIVLPVVLATVFGLSMDYQIFLLARVREAGSIATGLEANARAITTAAAIMVAVFGAFALTGVPAVREIGVGAAVAIALDATVVRLAVVPAALALFGRRAASLEAR